MNRLWTWLISFALLGSVMVACGGDDHDSHHDSRPLGVAGVMEGIWNGRLHSNVTGRDTGMFVIVTAGGTLDLLTSDCGQISASIAANGDFFSGAGTSYTRTNCDGLDVIVPSPSPISAPAQAFQISGQFDNQTGTASANYTTANDSGTISFINFYPDYFREPGVLSRAAGSYSVSQRLTALSVDANGNVVYQDASGQTFAGNLIVMDPGVDVYGMSLQVGGQSLTGLATLVNDGGGPNNDFLFAVANGTLAYNAELRRN
jgi:hypothetical protein